MSARRTLEIHSPAKVNLALSVGAPDATGMHPISSWMVTLDFGDRLRLTALEPESFSLFAIDWAEDAKRRSPIDWPITSDLGVRAHQALQAAVGRELPVKARLQKRIPVGGGLGGGSSNAAAMLRGVNDLFDLRLPTERLAEIGAALGSDVPFLVHGGSALVEGLGERLERHPRTPPLHLVLVFPDRACPTGAVYRAFDAARPDARLDAARVRTLAADGARVPPPQALFNDLAAPAGVVAPAILDDAEEIAALVDRPVHVSGSGSTLFFLCNGPTEAELLAAAVERTLALPAVAVRTQPAP